MVLKPSIDQPENRLGLGSQAPTNHLVYRWNPSYQGNNQYTLPGSTWQSDWLRPYVILKGRWRTEEM
eukprot:2648665-Amphidinium_carterae.1